MSIEELRIWVDVVQFALTAGIGFYLHIVTRQRVTESELDAHKDDVAAQLNGLGQRLTRVEEAGRHSPTHDHIGEVYEKLNAVSGQVHEVVGKLGGIERQMALMTEHLMKDRR